MLLLKKVKAILQTFDYSNCNATVNMTTETMTKHILHLQTTRGATHLETPFLKSRWRNFTKNQQQSLEPCRKANKNTRNTNLNLRKQSKLKKKNSRKSQRYANNPKKTTQLFLVPRFLLVLLDVPGAHDSRLVRGPDGYWASGGLSTISDIDAPVD